MGSNRQKDVNFMYGFWTSMFVHVFFFAFTIVVLENQAANAPKPQEVFTVTLEGGERLGGINQVPPDEQQRSAPKEQVLEGDPEPEPEPEPETAQKQIEAPTALEEKRKEEEKKEKEELKKKEDAEKKKAEDLKKKKEAEEKKKEEAEARKKAAEEKKRSDEEAKKKAASDKKARDQKFNEMIRRAKGGYAGESYDAGGRGIGAAALGGKGMGGGQLASLEFIAYRNQLENHIKKGWSWIQTGDNLVAQVQIVIEKDGTIRHVSIAAPSGNARFDDSVTRAVYKASPVPPPPARLYDRFREVRITFDTEKQ